jgi:TonB family protein
MFTPPNDRISLPQARTLGASLLLHALFLGWILHPPSARVLAPSSVAAGDQGTVLTHLYWPNQPVKDGATNTPNSHEHSNAQRQLTWKKSHKAGKAVAPELSASSSKDESQAEANAAKSSAPVAPAGMPYGTLAGGAATGDEIRPALPVSATDPVVDPRDLGGHGEGSVIVEITIDDQGDIVQKTVLQSLGPLIDGKVLSALENWHFLPATRNGVAIPSKQDVYYHFKPNS